MISGVRQVLAAFLAVVIPAHALAAPKLIRLQQGPMRIDLAPGHGGDLSGLEIRRGGRWVQLLFRGDDYSETKDWTGKAPILWPATGRNLLPTGVAGWRFDDATYPMAIHGFARDMPWKIERVEHGAKRTRARAILILTDTPATRARYPFGFKLTTEYALVGKMLTISQTVHADRRNARSMPFSIGNHITFQLPLIPSGDPSAVRFQTPARRQILTDQRGLPTGRVEPVDFKSPTPVSALGVRMAHSLGDYPSSRPWVRLMDPSGLTVTVSHMETLRPAVEPVLFNLWGDVGAGFFAPEPWVGKQNSLATGDGVITLPPGKDFRWAISIAVAND